MYRFVCIKETFVYKDFQSNYSCAIKSYYLNSQCTQAIKQTVCGFGNMVSITGF